ncbi:hypothetical protein [Nocardiopsis ganjiahuensis]|uniref:hypothetical protein n=1 Tax=Nocardiopsis ganjiahuensis TaxID=239984 RepID=UPI0003485821|nr:hypothetical protein [Nocardiopsis ganjiahuensis]
MAKAWMPGAERIDGGTTRTAVGIGAPRAVWTVTDTDPNMWSAREEALRLVHEGKTAHLVWNPLTGTVAQILAATRRSELVLGHTWRYGQFLDHGDEGRVCLVISVVSTEKEPFTDGPLVGLAPILAWLESWGVPGRWPAGPPGLWGERRPGPEEATRVWSRGGHFGHDQVPGSLATAPGRIDPGHVLAPGRSEAVSVNRAPLPREHAERQPSVIR